MLRRNNRAAHVTNSLSPPTVVAIGDNPTLLWGMTATERTRRIAGKAGLAFAETPPAEGACLLVNTAFAFDPPLARPYGRRGRGRCWSKDGVPAIAHVADRREQAAAMAAAMAGAALPEGDRTRSTTMPASRSTTTNCASASSRSSTPLTPATVRAIERRQLLSAPIRA